MKSYDLATGNENLKQCQALLTDIEVGSHYRTDFEANFQSICNMLQYAHEDLGSHARDVQFAVDRIGTAEKEYVKWSTHFAQLLKRFESTLLAGSEQHVAITSPRDISTSSENASIWNSYFELRQEAESLRTEIQQLKAKQLEQLKRQQFAVRSISQVAEPGEVSAMEEDNLKKSKEISRLTATVKSLSEELAAHKQATMTATSQPLIEPTGSAQTPASSTTPPSVRDGLVLLRENEALKKQIEDLNKSRAMEVSRSTSYQAQIDTLIVNLAKVKQDLDASTKQKESIKQQVDVLQQENTSLREQSARCATLTVDLGTLQRISSSQAQRIASLERQLADNTSQLNIKMEKLVSDHSLEVGRYATEMAALKSANAKLEQTILHLQSELTAKIAHETHRSTDATSAHFERSTTPPPSGSSYSPISPLGTTFSISSPASDDNDSKKLKALLAETQRQLRETKVKLAQAEGSLAQLRR